MNKNEFKVFQKVIAHCQSHEEYEAFIQTGETPAMKLSAEEQEILRAGQETATSSGDPYSNAGGKKTVYSTRKKRR